MSPNGGRSIIQSFLHAVAAPGAAACAAACAGVPCRWPIEELQRRLIEPEDDEEAARRATLAKQRLGPQGEADWGGK